MRQIIFDTETTGIDPRSGHRIVEIACLELIGGKETGKIYHKYINPTIPIPADVFAIHGLSDEFLSDKPTFNQIVDEFIDFIRDAELIAHNAAFDTGFVNNELAMVGKGVLSDYCPAVIDTLQIAKQSRPDRKNSLDALCQDYGINNSSRLIHGALLDVKLLAKLYIALKQS